MNKESVFWENGGLNKGEKDRGKTFENTLEGWYGGEQWWKDMKKRIQRKDKRQVDLERELVETVGNPADEGNVQINVEQIENLIEEGAKPDFWVGQKEFQEEDGGVMWTVMEMALYNVSHDGKRATKILVDAFPEFRADETKGAKSLLGYAFAINRNWEVVLETKRHKNPIVAFLRWSGETTSSKKDKFKQLVAIGRRYPFGPEIKKALSWLHKFQEMREKNTVLNMPVLMEYCNSNSKDLTNFLGGSYKIKDEMAFQFPFKKKDIWVAQFLQDHGMTGLVDVRKTASGVSIRCGQIIGMPMIRGKIIDCSGCPTTEECICGNFADFVKKNGNFQLNLDLLLGIGGESIVFKAQGKGKLKACKIIPYNEIRPDSKLVIEEAHRKYAESRLTLSSANKNLALEMEELLHTSCQLSEKAKEISEFNFSEIKHENLMEYDDFTIDIVHGKFCIIVGESALDFLTQTSNRFVLFFK